MCLDDIEPILEELRLELFGIGGVEQRLNGFAWGIGLAGWRMDSSHGHSFGENAGAIYERNFCQITGKWAEGVCLALADRGLGD